MNMKKVTLAAAILFALTGCGSSGGGSSNPTPNSEVNNNQTTQTQVEKQKAEVEALKNQLAQAQANQKQAEDKLKSAEKTHNQDLTKAKNNLASAQANLNKAQSALKQAESKLTTQQKTQINLQDQLNEASQKLSTAQQEKLLAEKELNDKLAEENKLMTRAEVLDFALHNGLYKEDSEEFADDYQNKPKSFVIDQLVYTHKIIAMKNLARRYGLPEVDVRAFTKENKNKTLEEAAKILDNQREEIAKKREAFNNELLAIAKEKGLEDWEASNFVYGRNHTDKEQALKDLNNYLNEKAERETKLNELIQLAKEKGLEDWEASSFANNHVDEELSKALAELDKFVEQKIKQAKETYILKVATPEGFTPKHQLEKTPVYDGIGRKTEFENITYADVYNQKYSIIVGQFYDEGKDLESGVRTTYNLDLNGVNIKGVQPEKIPTEGKAMYNGIAFTADKQGNLEYSVNFSEKTGQGSIKGLSDIGDLILEKGEIIDLFGQKGRTGASSTVTAIDWKGQNVSGNYLLQFYGPNAEEIAGRVNLHQENWDKQNSKFLIDVATSTGSNGSPKVFSTDVNIGFGGTRGEIQK